MANVEDDSPLGVMNKIRKEFKAKSRRLARKISRDTIETLDINEESYRELEADVRTFLLNLELWEQGLPHIGDRVEDDDQDDYEEDDQGDPIYPEAGPGAGYILGRVKVILAGFQEDKEKICLEFVRFKKA